MSSTSVTHAFANPSTIFQRLQFTGDASQPVSHCCIWDDLPPTHSNGQDVYNFKVLVTSNTTGPKRSRIYATNVKVVVDQPKTANAVIASIVTTSTPVSGPIYDNVAGFEPVVAGDGNLLVMRIASDAHTWTMPGSSQQVTNRYDVVYSYYEEDSGANTADPTKWKNVIPITFAFKDARINTKFGFAFRQFRDAAGNFIAAGEDLGGSYPWIDRGAKNLFFEGVRDQLVDQSTSTPRYTNGQVPGDNWYTSNAGENTHFHQGVSFVGLWSHGKIVQVDNLLNDMDYAIGNGSGTGANNPQTRMVDLFQPNTDPTTVRDGKIELGYGRATTFMPSGENDNGNIIDSVESKLAYRKSIVPIRLQDVAWNITNGKQTDELGFDDYNDPDAFIIANMSGLLTWEVGVVLAPAHSSVLKHHSGWNGTSFSDPIRFQNGATAPLGTWDVPSFGTLVGGGRLEPSAAGGVHGKGLWLTGSNGLQFTVPVQPTGVGTRDWYAGVFVDCRFGNDTAERRVLTFPDGSSLRLYGRSQILYVDNAGSVAHRITLPSATATLPDLLPEFGWAHLAVQIRDGGRFVDFHLNGLLFDRWTDAVGGTQLFQMTSGTFTLGKVAGNSVQGFLGWTDDLKVFAHTVDMETACNHANATLVGMTAGANGPWATDHADRYPAWAHAEVSAQLRNLGETPSAKYAPFHDYGADNEVYEGAIAAAGVVRHRSGFHFPEGPLFWNAPRPDSVNNQFCASCHHTAGQGGLDLAAVSLIPGLPAYRDGRRQPSQPPVLLHGLIPAGLVTQTNHATPQPASQQIGPKPVDLYMQETYANNAAVTSLTLIDAVSGKDLMELTNGAVVDPARLGTSSFAIRANLDVGQGAVSIGLDGLFQAPSNQPPHVIFGAGTTLAPGPHTAQAQGDNGVNLTVNFTVPTGWRAVADYRDDFQAVSPTKGWSYGWNANGSVSTPGALRPLFWTPASNRYSGNGLTFPDSGNAGFTLFHANGGHPGAGTQQGQAVDRCAVAVYQVAATGSYRISSGTVRMPNGSSNGGRIYVMTQSGGAITTHQNQQFPASTDTAIAMSTVSLNAGDLIMVAVGPSGHGSFDSFTLDYAIEAN